MKHENIIEKICEYQNALKDNELLMALFDSISPQILRWKRNNEIALEIGQDNYIPCLYVLNTNTFELKTVWTYEKGWL